MRLTRPILFSLFMLVRASFVVVGFNIWFLVSFLNTGSETPGGKNNEIERTNILPLFNSIGLGNNPQHWFLEIWSFAEISGTLLFKFSDLKKSVLKLKANFIFDRQFPGSHLNNRAHLTHEPTPGHCLHPPYLQRYPSAHYVRTHSQAGQYWADPANFAAQRNVPLYLLFCTIDFTWKQWTACEQKCS